MRIALDPQTHESITPEQFIARYGRTPIGSSTSSVRAICESCEQELSLVGGKTTNTQAHFSHFPNSGFCPTKKSAGRPYENMRPTNPDPKHARLIRAAFVNRWQWVYSEIQRLVPELDAQEFLELVKRADKDEIWGYRHLTLLQVPELFLMLADFPPHTSRFKRRIYWMRFWYSANIRSIEDLWITPPTEVRLLRASYRVVPGSKAAPGINQLVAIRCQQRSHAIPPIDPDLKDGFALRVIPPKLAG